MLSPTQQHAQREMGRGFWLGGLSIVSLLSAVWQNSMPVVLAELTVPFLINGPTKRTKEAKRREAELSTLTRQNARGLFDDLN